MAEEGGEEEEEEEEEEGAGDWSRKKTDLSRSAGWAERSSGTRVLSMLCGCSGGGGGGGESI